ncbi:MAG: acyl carrier protein [Dehalococcoidales bacterium]|jgi:acyl carrier protein|nr:acyl carrier protein [Dehalococcoidales bacterium]MDD4230681.1 acyl carrier protein [Dehalococcoidales bacterium]MDD4465738.1 acyl carrier protein [Dehalococcoidales bacterium]
MSVYEEFRRSVARVTRTAEQDITPETLLKNIKADSFHWVQIFIALESALDIELNVDQEVMKQLVTVDDFVKYIEKSM